MEINSLTFNAFIAGKPDLGEAKQSASEPFTQNAVLSQRLFSISITLYL